MAQRAKTTAKRTLRPVTRPLREAETGQSSNAYYRELQTLHDISQTVLASMDIQTILERILDKALLAGSFDIGVIRLLDASGGTLRPMAHRGYRNPANVHSKTTDPKDEATGMILVQVMAARGSYQIEDVAHSPGMRSFRKEGVRSAIVVPVRAGEEILGVIQLGSRKARRFKPHEIHLFEAIGNQMGLAVQKARLFEQAEQRLKHAEALRDIGLSLTATHDPMQVLTRAAEEARRLTGALFAFVVTPDKPFYKITAVAGEDKKYREVLKLSDDPASPYGQGPLGRAIRSRERVVCEDVLMDPLFKPWREIASERGIRSLVAVPLIVQDKPYGAILTYAAIPRAYDAETMGLLGSLAAQAAAALENARLFEETQHRAQEQATLSAIATATTQSLHIDEMLQIALDKVLEVTGREKGYIRLKDPATGEINLAAHRGVSREYTETLLRRRTPGGKSDRVFESGEPLVVNDPDGTILKGETRREGLRSIAWIPVKAHGKAVGILNVSTTRPIPFAPREVELLVAVGNVIGVAVENARLFEETKGSLERIRLLREIDTAIASTLDLHALLDLLLEKIDSALPYLTATTVRLLNSDTGVLEPAACRNLDVDEWKTSAGRKSRGPGNWVLEKRAPVVVRNVQAGLLILDREFFRKYGLVSYVGVPLIAEDKVIGVIGFYTKDEHEFASEELEFLSTLAGQAAIAIHKCQLYEAMARSNKVKDEFLSVMSHELRTPLTSLMGYTGMMQEGVLGEISREQEKALEKMAGFSKSLLAMIETIMEATKVETGAIVVERQDVNLIDALDTLKSGYDRSVGKDISLVWDYPDDLPTIQTDAAKLKQILQHLLNNAIKFTEKGRAMVSVRIKEGNGPRAHPKADPPVAETHWDPTRPARPAPSAFPRWVEFKIVDTGIGIPEEIIPVIFEKFRQVDSSETRLHGGVGLGLYIVKAFTELLGGTIEVQSELGHGSTFTVTLPCEGENVASVKKDKGCRVSPGATDNG